MNIKRNIESIRSEISPLGARLVVVSKTQPGQMIQEAYNAGQRIFGENRAQEMAAKYEQLPNDIEWHLIGHLQSNKIKYIAPFAAMIQSVDSEKLMDEIDKQGKKIGRVIPCLLQIHIAREETKSGFNREELLQFIGSGKSYTHVSVRGLMGMATFAEDREQVRQEFKTLKRLFDEIKTKNLPSFPMIELSMGMSGDYKIAIEEGSTLVRIGTAIFGERTNP